MKKQGNLLFLATMMMLLIALSACSSEVSSQAPAEPLSVTIEGHDIRYEPQTVEVRSGQPVQLTFANHGSLEHDVTFDVLPVAGEEVIALAGETEHEDGEEAEHTHEEEVGDEHEGEAEHTHEEGAEGEHEEEAGHSQEGEGEALEGASHSHEDAAVHVHTVGGEEAAVTFTPTEPGVYEFYCSVPGHRDAGMIGTLIVSEG